MYFFQVLASVPEKDAVLLEPLQELGCATTHNNLDTVHNTDVLLLGVKPTVVPHVAKELKNKGQGQLLISVAAGSTLIQEISNIRIISFR